MSKYNLGGHGRLMRRAIEFAEKNGFTWQILKKNQIAFYGHGGRVIAAGTPASECAAIRAIQAMRRLVKEALREDDALAGLQRYAA